MHNVGQSREVTDEMQTYGEFPKWQIPDASKESQHNKQNYVNVFILAKKTNTINAFNILKRGTNMIRSKRNKTKTYQICLDFHKLSDEMLEVK